MVSIKFVISTCCI